LSGTGVCSSRSHAPTYEPSWFTSESPISRSREVKVPSDASETPEISAASRLHK